jgi:hypothetical protein
VLPLQLSDELGAKREIGSIIRSTSTRKPPPRYLLPRSERGSIAEMRQTEVEHPLEGRRKPVDLQADHQARQHSSGPLYERESAPLTAYAAAVDGQPMSKDTNTMYELPVN